MKAAPSHLPAPRLTHSGKARGPAPSSGRSGEHGGSEHRRRLHVGGSGWRLAVPVPLALALQSLLVHTDHKLGGVLPMRGT